MNFQGTPRDSSPASRMRCPLIAIICLSSARTESILDPRATGHGSTVLGVEVTRSGRGGGHRCFGSRRSSPLSHGQTQVSAASDAGPGQKRMDMALDALAERQCLAEGSGRRRGERGKTAGRPARTAEAAAAAASRQEATDRDVPAARQEQLGAARWCQRGSRGCVELRRAAHMAVSGGPPGVWPLRSGPWRSSIGTARHGGSSGLQQQQQRRHPYPVLGSAVCVDFCAWCSRQRGRDATGDALTNAHRPRARNAAVTGARAPAASNGSVKCGLGGQRRAARPNGGKVSDTEKKTAAVWAGDEWAQLLIKLRSRRTRGLLVARAREP
jgi:hypothetical protein